VSALVVGLAAGSVPRRDHNGEVSDADPIEGDEVARYGLGRLLALSDGVFAIALTVLVLSLHVDVSTPAADVGGAIHRSWSEVYAYALSVVVIGAFWMGHHRLYARVTRADALILWMNVVFLGLVALIPYPTDLLGRYGGESDPVALYGGVIGLGALVGAGIALYAGHRGLIGRAASYRAVLRGGPIAAVFLLSVPIAFLSPKGAQLFWLFAIPVRMMTSRSRVFDVR
jgi:uncharacterized membrane protein